MYNLKNKNIYQHFKQNVLKNSLVYRTTLDFFESRQIKEKNVKKSIDLLCNDYNAPYFLCVHYTIYALQ